MPRPKPIKPLLKTESYTVEQVPLTRGDCGKHDDHTLPCPNTSRRECWVRAPLHHRVSMQTERGVAISAAISAHIHYFQRGLGNHLWFRQGSQTMFLWQNMFFLAVWTVLGKNRWGFAGDRFGVCFLSFQHFVDSLVPAALVWTHFSAFTWCGLSWIAPRSYATWLRNCAFLTCAFVWF